MAYPNYLISTVSLLLILAGFSVHAQQLKVMTYNIHHGADAAERMTIDDIGAFIKASGADLVGLQEVDSLCGRSGQIDQMKVLAEITGMHYTFYRHFAYDGGAYGLGILSRYPISEERNERITSLQNGEEASLAFLAVTVRIGNQDIVFSTVHFALDQPTRLAQANEVLHFLDGSDPVILTGDFNALPNTEEIQLIADRLPFLDQKEAYTFPTGAPIKKIDYIFVSPSLLSKRIGTTVWEDIHHSDHLPLEAKLDLN